MLRMWQQALKKKTKVINEVLKFLLKHVIKRILKTSSHLTIGEVVGIITPIIGQIAPIVIAMIENQDIGDGIMRLIETICDKV
jgi:hypothetical protein